MRVWAGGSTRRKAVIVACAAGAILTVGAVLGLAASGTFSGGGANAVSSMPTGGAFAPFHFNRSPGSDPDPNTVGGQDMTSVLSRTPGHGRYRLEVSNISDLGFIDGFNWVPPTGMRLLRVSAASSGACRLSAGSGGSGTRAFPALICTKVSLKPPSCTCRGDGGSVVVHFVAKNGDDSGFLAGATKIVSATPVFKAIPGYLTAAAPPSGSGGSAANGTTSTQG